MFSSLLWGVIRDLHPYKEGSHINLLQMTNTKHAINIQTTSSCTKSQQCVDQLYKMWAQIWRFSNNISLSTPNKVTFGILHCTQTQHVAPQRMFERVTVSAFVRMSRTAPT